MENTKFIINKYKNKTFKEVKEIILTSDNKYYSFLQRALLKDNTNEKKKENIIAFLKYWDETNTIENIPEKEKTPTTIIETKTIDLEKFKPITIQTQIKKVSKIFHISDVHIRLYSRFDEYQIVFNNLYQFLDEKKRQLEDVNLNGIIVITGDLLHSKNQLSPECILFTYKFLKALADIFPTFLIAGNHDALLTNNQRIDSITAIIKNRNINNLHYLQYSGCYHFANICFGVCSLLDDKWVYSTQLEYEPSMLKIALYHGGVGEFETGVGFRMRGEKLIKDFDGYDFILLGDIHKFQFLDEEKKRIAYASSLVAQNFSECDSNHGVLVWDTIHSNHEYFKINNDSGFLILRLENERVYYQRGDDEITEEELVSMHFPSNLNLKLVIKNSGQPFVKKIVKLLRSKTIDLKIHYSFIHNEEENILPLSKNNNNESDNFELQFNEDSMTKWIEHYLKLRKNINDEVLIKKITDKFQNYNTEKLNIKEKSICRWELIDLQFSNLFSYGENNYIDFSKFNDASVVGVLAPNSYGKSSLIDIILFSLFGRISRSQGYGVSKDLINIDKDKFDTKLTFKIGSEIYIIEKEGRREKSGKIKITKEEFYKFKNGEKVILTEESRIKTDKILNEHIGDMQEFIFTNIQLQNRDKSFKDLTNKERKEFLHNILNLDMFETILPTISSDTKNIKSDMDVLNKSLKNISIEELETDKSEVTLKIEELENNINEQENLYNSLQNEIEEKRKQLFFIDDKLYNLGEDSILNLIKTLEDNRVVYINNGEKLEKQIVEQNDQLKMLNILKSKNKIIKEYKKFNETKEKEIRKLEKEIATLEKKKIPKINLEVLYEQLNIVDNNDIEQINKSLDEYNEQIEKISNEIENQKKKETNIRNEFNIYQTTNSEKLENHKALIEELSEELLELQSQLWKFDKDDLRFLKRDFTEELDKRTKCQSKKKTLDKKLKELKKSLENEAEISNKIEEIEKEKEIHQEIKKLQDEITIHQKILDKFKNHKYDPNCKYCMSNSITNEVNEAKEKTEQAKNIISNLQKTIKYDNDEIKRVNELYTEIHKNKSSIETKELENQLNNSELQILEELFAKKEKLSKYKKSNKQIRAKIEEINIQIDENKNSEKEINSKINQFTNDIQSMSTEILKNITLQKDIQNKFDLSSKLKKKIEKNQEIDEQNKEVQEEINTLISKLDSKKDEKHEEYELLTEQLEQKDLLDQEIEKVTKLLEENNKTILKISEDINENKNKIEKMKEMKQYKDANEIINQDINELNITRQEINNEILKMREEKGYFSNKVETIADQIITFNKSFNEFLEVKEKYSINKYLEECIGRDGIPLMLLEQYLPAIQQHINEIINPFINREISIKLQGDTIQFESFPSYSEHSVMIHGGMESFILDLAFKITLSKYAMLPKCDTLFLDEGISAFDKEKLSSIDTLFNFLKNHFNKIILITHIDQVKDHINEKIEIEKEGNHSHIVCFYG